MSLLLLLLPFVVFGEQLQYNSGGEGISAIVVKVDDTEKTVDEDIKDTFTQQNSEEEVFSLGTYADFDITVTLSIPDDSATVIVYEIYIELQPAACTMEAETITLNGVSLTTNQQDTGGGNGIITLSADIDNNGIELSGATDFTLQFTGDLPTCEPGVFLNYIFVDADMITPTPTDAPTERPTDSPTGNPTLPDPASCSGVLTWGDVHAQTFGFSGRQMDEQELGEIYYMYPCDYRLRDEYPYHVTATHKRCWWRGNAFACVDYSTIYVTTAGDPWEIKIGQQFTAGGGAEVTVGTDVSYSQSDFDNARLPMSIDYDDGSGNKGEIEIYVNSDNKVVFTLNVQSHNMIVDETTLIDCSDKIDVEVHIYHDWLYIACPECYRNLVCGVLGWYTATDCWSPGSTGNALKCEEELRLWNFTYLPTPHTWWKYGIFAAAWNKADVDSRVDDALSLKSHTLSLPAKPKLQPIMLDDPTEALVKSNRAVEDLDSVTVVDGNVPEYPGVCNDSDSKVDYVNNLCENKIAEYAECCKEIGICDMFENSCTYDMCQCLVFQNETTCLYNFVDISLNKTCSEDALYPTDAPSASPTKRPTSFIEKSTEAEALVWYATAFVILFVIAAGVAYWYYRKKNSKNVYIDDEDERTEMAGSGQTQAITATEI